MSSVSHAAEVSSEKLTRWKNKPSEQKGEVSLVGFEKGFVQTEQTEKSEYSNDKSNIHEQFPEYENIHEHAHELDGESCELVTMAEAALRLGMPYPTLRRQVLSGKIPSALGIDGKPLVKMSVNEHADRTNEQKKSAPEQTEFSSEYSVTIQGLLRQVEAERNYAKALNEKLEAANHRNGYLEAQIEAKVEHIKLLTDSEHNKGWWARFATWFVGQK